MCLKKVKQICEGSKRNTRFNAEGLPWTFCVTALPVEQQTLPKLHRFRVLNWKELSTTEALKNKQTKLYYACNRLLFLSSFPHRARPTIVLSVFV